MVYLIFLALFVLGIYTYYSTKGSRLSRMINSFTKVIVTIFLLLIFVTLYLFYKEIFLGY